MVDVLIELARNLRTKDEESPDKANQGDAYVCIKCDQEVVLIAPFVDKNGTSYQQHFRHRPYAQVLDCIWRTEEEVREIREIALREFSELIQRKRLRVFLEQEPFSNKFGLFAELRALTPGELGVIRAASGVRPADHIRIPFEGALRQPTGQEILPSMGILRVPLDPHAKGYALTVEAPGEFDLKGVWSAPGLGTTAVFVGQANSAEYITSPQYLAEGETVFMLTPRKDNLPEGATLVSLGRHQLIRVTVQRNIEPWLKDRIKSLEAIAASPLRVSVLLPFLHDPRAERLVRAEPGARCVLAVTPPTNHDPALEVIAWTGHAYEQQTLAQTGLGRPRFIEFQTTASPTHLLIHWPGYRGRDVRLQIAPVEKPPAAMRAVVPDFGVEAEDGSRALAEFGEVLTLNPILTYDPDHPMRAPAVGLLGFAQLEVRLIALYPDEHGNPRQKDEGAIRGEEFTNHVNGLFEAGAGRIVIDFDTLGRVCLDFDYFYDERVKRETREREIEQKAKILREAPPTPKPKAQATLPAVPDPLASLAESLKAKQPPTLGAKTTSTDPPQQQSPPRDRYSKLMADKTLQHRLRSLRPYPPKATREFSARFLGLPLSKSNIPEVDEWRNPLNRFIRQHPEDVGRSTAASSPEPTTPVPRKKRHHDDRRPKNNQNDPSPPITLGAIPDTFEIGANMEGETRAQELDRLRQLRERIQNRIAELEAEPADTNSPETNPPQPAVPKSKRVALKASRDAAPEAPPHHDQPAPASKDGFTPEKAHKMMRELEKRLAALDDEPPEKASAEFVATLYGCQQDTASLFLTRYVGKINAAITRERRRRDD